MIPHGGTEGSVDQETAAIDFIQARFPTAVLAVAESSGQKWVEVSRDQVVAVLTALRDEQGWDMLMDLTAVDYQGKETPERFQLVYQLYSLAHNSYFRVKCWVPESDPTADTVTHLWKAAPWAEREVWDMYGLRFNGNNDLRRILTPFSYEGHPLRKDYPLQGRGERNQFPRYEK